MPSHADTASTPKGTIPMAMAEYTAAIRSVAPAPMMKETTRQIGATVHHSTVAFASSSRRSTSGRSMAPRTRIESEASTLVAGTSEYIQLDSTKAKARLPWSENRSLKRGGGRKNHADDMRAALIATVRRVSKGGCRTRDISA